MRATYDHLSLVSKKVLIEQIIQQLERDLKLIQDAALVAREAATHEESRAEDKYDTRGLEASYLAGAQARRAAQIEQLISQYRHLESKDFANDSPIAITALIELETSDDRKRALYFLVPRGGAMTLNLDLRTIQVVTLDSPMGKALLGRKKGDEFVVSTPKSTSTYVISSVT